MTRVNELGIDDPADTMPVAYLLSDDGGFVVMCPECAAKADNTLPLAPLYIINIYPYRQTCHLCGKIVVVAQGPAWPELFDLRRLA